MYTFNTKLIFGGLVSLLGGFKCCGILLLISLIVGCGQMGPLELPNKTSSELSSN